MASSQFDQANVLSNITADARKSAAAIEVKPEDLSPQEMIDYLEAKMEGRIAAAIQPIANNQIVAQAQQQVAAASGKYTDYWDYKDEMLQIAQRHPTITADEAYWMAKGRGGEKKAEPAKKVAPKTEAPTTGMSRGSHKQLQKGLPAKMDAAWKEGFGNSQVAE